MTGAPVGAFHFEPKSERKLNSWDRFLIPMPFTRICVSWAQWTRVSTNLPAEEFETKRGELNAALERARKRAYLHLAKARK
jgi:hypothetical protein